MKIYDPTPKPFLDHLEDLRWVLIKSGAAFGLAFLVGLALTKPLLLLFYQPLIRAGQDPAAMLRVLGVADPLSIQIELGFLSGILLSLPFILFFVGQFLLPALTPREAKAVLPSFVGGAVLFAGGVAFCFYVIIPQTLRFFITYNNYLGFRTEWTIQNYVDFLLQMLLAFGISFELPLVLVLLNVFGIVRHETLKSYRRHTFVLLVILACCIIPATDPLSLSMLVVPMYALFEGTLALLWFLERGRREKELWPDGPQ